MIGLPLEAFWKISPRQLAWHHAASRRRDREQAETALTVAWVRESLARRKKLPKLNEWLESTRVRSPDRPRQLGTAREFMRHLTIIHRSGNVVDLRATAESSADQQEPARG